MQRGLGAEEPELENQKHDTEVTLGPAMLLAILCGLLLLCGLFYTVGYRAGRRSALAGISVTQTSGGQTLTSMAGSALSKPPAKGLVPDTPPPSSQVVQTSRPATLDGSPSGSALTSYAPVGGSAVAPSLPQVRSALPAPSNAVQAASVPLPSGSQVQPAFGQGSPIIMVQVAAVSHMEDANVLMSALRKRGYAVMARRGFADNLIHVQIGPFATRAEATAMSQRLLGDGYNAEVLP
jgi:cell division septation protein DedD